TADAVSSAVVEIEPSLPQCCAGQRIELRAAGVLGEDGSRNGNVTFEYARETVAHFVTRLADDYSASDVGGAVFVLCARIDQEQLIFTDAAVRSLRHAVMHDGTIRPSTGDCGERDILERSRIAAKGLKRGHRINFGEFARGRFFIEPDQKARDR